MSEYARFHGAREGRNARLLLTGALQIGRRDLHCGPAIRHTLLEPDFRPVVRFSSEKDSSWGGHAVRQPPAPLDLYGVPSDDHDAETNLTSATKTRRERQIFALFTIYTLSEASRAWGCSPVGLARGDPSPPLVSNPSTLAVILQDENERKRRQKRQKAARRGHRCVRAELFLFCLPARRKSSFKIRKTEGVFTTMKNPTTRRSQ